MEQYSPEQLKLIARFKDLRPQSPDPLFLQSLRSTLLSAVAHEETAPVRSAAFWRIAGRVALTVASIALAGIGASFASQYIMPNSVLYPVKLAAEHAQINLAGDGIANTLSLRSKFAETRIAEMKTLEASDQLDSAATASALAEYRQTLDDMQTDVNRIAGSDSAKTLPDLTAVELKLDALGTGIADLAVNTGTSTLSQTAQQQLTDASIASQALRIDVKTKVLSYELAHQSFDDKAVARVAFVLESERSTYGAVSRLAEEKLQTDTLALLKQESASHPSVAPDKLTVVLPQADQDMQAALMGIEAELESLASKVNEPGAQLNATELSNLIERLFAVSGRISQIGATLSNRGS